MVSFTPKGLIKPDPPTTDGPPPTGTPDGDLVDINELNANLDRISLLGVGGRPLISSEWPALGSIDDMPGTIIFETDNNGILVRRINANTSGFDDQYRSIAPGNWQEWNTNNVFSSWLSGDNNRKHVRVAILGRLVHVHVEVRIGSGGDVIAGSLLPAQLPVNRDTDSVNGSGADAITAGPWPIGHAVANIGGDVHFGRIILVNAQPMVRTVPTSNTSAGSTWGPTTPGDWAPGDGAAFDYTYWSY